MSEADGSNSTSPVFSWLLMISGREENCLPVLAI
jgi:hypothetical protein